MSKLITKASACAASICLIAGTAFAAQAEDFEFRYNASELETSYGVEKLYKRIENKVERHCTISGRRPLHAIAQEEACIEDMMQDIMARIDDPRLDRYANLENGQTQVSRN